MVLKVIHDTVFESALIYHFYLIIQLYCLEEY